MIDLKVPETVINTLRPYWQRRWLLIGVAWVISLLGWVVVASLPDRYDAMTRIHVDTENMLTPLLRNIAVQSDIQKQIEVLQVTMLNRNNLAQLAHATDMDLDAATDYDKERLYAAIAARVKIKAEGKNLFTVSFGDHSPTRAKKAVETLLNLFIESNLGQNRSNMENARNFLQNQIQEYEQKLKDADQRVAEFKSQNQDLLAATGANFTSRLETVRQRVMDAQSRVETAEVTRTQLRANLATTPQFLEVAAPPQVVINNSGGIATGASAAARVSQLRQELASMQTRFTDSHPDVIAAKQALTAAEAMAEKEAKEQKGGSAPLGRNTSLSNPVYEQLKLRVIQADADAAQARAQLASNETEFQRLRSLSETAPKVEAGLADLNREYGVVKMKYEELLSRRESARISEAVEASGDKVQFRIIEPPRVPTRPAFPNRPLFNALVLVIGLGTGFGLVVLLHRLDNTVDSIETLTNDFNLTVIGSVARVDCSVRAQERLRSRRHFALASGGLVAAFLLLIVADYFWQMPTLLARTPVPSLLQGLHNYAG